MPNRSGIQLDLSSAKLRPFHLRSRSLNALDLSPLDDDHDSFSVSPTYVAWSTDSPPPSVPGPHAISRTASSPLLSSRYHAELQPYRDILPFGSVKPLSPIVEQDYFSPERHSQALPKEVARFSTPTGSQYSEITRPSPTYSTFINRPLNRSLSQASSRSYVSGSSAPPSIPPLDLRPNFSSQLNIRFPKPAALRTTMPTIVDGSAEGYNGMMYVDESSSSLRAESFITAQVIEIDSNDAIAAAGRHSPLEGSGSIPSYRAHRHARSYSIASQARSVQSTETSSTTSFFDRRWRQSESFGSGFALSSFPKVPKSPFKHSLTPACWLFFLGFIAPWCWMIGGWYYTIRGQRRPKYRKKKGMKDLMLPMWVMTRQGLSGIRLTEKEVHSHGVWFGYPFVATNDDLKGGKRSLSSVRSPPIIRTKQPRVLDPWIFRCRVATFVSGILLTIGFIVAFVVLQNKSRL